VYHLATTSRAKKRETFTIFNGCHGQVGDASAEKKREKVSCQQQPTLASSSSSSSSGAPPYIYYECNIERKFDRICTEKKNMKDLLFLAS